MKKVSLLSASLALGVLFSPLTEVLNEDSVITAQAKHKEQTAKDLKKYTTYKNMSTQSAYVLGDKKKVSFKVPEISTKYIKSAKIPLAEGNLDKEVSDFVKSNMKDNWGTLSPNTDSKKSTKVSYTVKVKPVVADSRMLTFVVDMKQTYKRGNKNKVTEPLMQQYVNISTTTGKVLKIKDFVKKNKANKKKLTEFTFKRENTTKEQEIKLYGKENVAYNTQFRFLLFKNSTSWYISKKGNMVLKDYIFYSDKYTKTKILKKNLKK